MSAGPTICMGRAGRSPSPTSARRMSSSKLSSRARNSSAFRKIRISTARRRKGPDITNSTRAAGFVAAPRSAICGPIKRHPKLSVRTGALASRILFDGRRAKGVAYAWRGGEHEVRARREVILSAGAIQSPQLLQLSGVGPADLLAETGVPLLHASPEVGENLQDHLQIPADLPLHQADHDERPASLADRACPHRLAMAHLPLRPARRRHQPGRDFRARLARIPSPRRAVPLRHAVRRHGGRQGA